MDNPLLEDQTLPPFARIRVEHIEPAIDQLIADGRRLIAALGEHPETATWDNFVQPIEAEDDRLSRAWSPVSHLNSVMSSDALRAAYNACLPKLSDYATEVGHNEALYRGYQAVADQDGLDPAQRKMLSNVLRDLRLAGVDLPPDRKARFKAISSRLSQLTSTYEENVLDATNAWQKTITDETQLAGLPESALALARHLASERELNGWLLTLDIPSYLPVMKHADNRELRRELYEAYTTRASDCGPHAGQWDNSAAMEEILALRHEQAQLLGFPSYAALSLEPKMARTTDEVMTFLHDLARRCMPQARRELTEVESFSREHGGPETLEPWDAPYWSEKLRQSRYAISDEELKPYFAMDRVIQGMFDVAQRLFDIRITRAKNDDVWHADVRFYEITDSSGSQRAQFYLDPFARQKKRGGAWMGVCANRMIDVNRHQLPVAYLVCNFSPPVDGQPTLLTHDEVQTLFHEFGHGLHHMLTRVDYPAVAGINGVPWDAVELPSQFLENWCWERESLDMFARHWESDKPMPQALYERMREARTFQSAMQMARQLELALFDFRLHLEYDPNKGGAQIAAILDEVRGETAVIKPPAFNRFAHAFSHIFAGGYAAGYYSYKWAELLSADAFSLFEERGIMDTPSGRSFRENILEQGGSADPLELYVSFRGREPRIDALLRHSGISG